MLRNYTHVCRSNSAQQSAEELIEGESLQVTKAAWFDQMRSTVPTANFVGYVFNFVFLGSVAVAL